MISRGHIEFNSPTGQQKSQRQPKQKNDPEKPILTEFISMVKGEEEKKDEAEMEGSKAHSDLVVRIKDYTPQEKLEQLVEKSRDPLIVIKTALPLDLTPREVIIDLSQLTVVTREVLLGAEYIHSSSIEDIMDVQVETTPFFATMKITDRGLVENLITVKYLKKKGSD